MKNELIRFQNVSFEIKGKKYGPFSVQLFEGEIIGILTDDFFDKELLISLFCGKIQIKKGFLYLKESLISMDEQAKAIKKMNAEWITVISERSRLFGALSIVENIFFPHFLIVTRKLNKILNELFFHFQLDIPPGKPIRELTNLERIEVELMRAVASERKIIIVSDVNKLLRNQDILALNRIYRRLAQMGYTICVIETLSDISIEWMNYFSLIRDGATVGGGYRGEYSYQEMFQLLNMQDSREEYQHLMKKRERRYYTDQNVGILDWSGVTGEKIRELSMCVKQREIVEIVCQKHSGYVELTGILKGECSPLSGEIFFNGDAITAQGLRSNIRKWNMGCIDVTVNPLFANKSVIENICYPFCQKVPFFYLHRKYIKAATDYIHDIAEEVNLNAAVSSVSMDEMVWISICKWLLCKPQLLLFFIPATSGMESLDIVIEKLFIELILQGTSILLVTEQHKITSEIIDIELTV